MQKEKLVYVNPKEISIHKNVPNSRKNITKNDIKDLLNSIKERGIKNPIRVFELDGEYFLVSGERRLRCSLELKMKEVPCIVSEYGKSEEEIFENAEYDNIIENVQREDLNGFDLANAIQRLLDKGLNQKEISSKVGKSITWVSEVLRFNAASDDLKELVKKDEISLGEGMKIAKLDENLQGRAGKALSKAKEEAAKTGDKTKKKKLKESIEKATRVRSSPMPGKMEIKQNLNMLTEVLTEMKKDENASDSKQFFGLIGTQFALRWVCGEEASLTKNIEKLLKKYNIEVGKDGKKLNEKALEKKKKQDEKKKVKKESSKKKSSKKKSPKKTSKKKS